MRFSCISVKLSLVSSDEERVHRGSPSFSTEESQEEPSSLERYAITPPVNRRERKRSSDRRVRLPGGSNKNPMQKRHSNSNLNSLDDVSCQIEASSPPEICHLFPRFDLSERGQSFSHRRKKETTKTRSFDRDLKRSASDASSYSNSRPAIKSNSSAQIEWQIF